MSCRHDLANVTCSRCYPTTGTINPGPESKYGPNLEGPGAVTREEYLDVLSAKAAAAHLRKRGKGRT